MTAPALVFSVVAATAAAAVYHLVFGRSLRQLGMFWLASLAGFAAGQAIALPLHLPHLGPVHLTEDLAGALALMSVVKLARL